MKKHISLILSAVIGFSSVSFFAPVVRAYDNTLTISTVEELIDFSKKCTLDSFSEGLTVELQNDIDVKHTDFVCIPCFAGTFNGNGHTIKGLNIVKKDSSMGFMRYTTEKARIKNLKIQGNVQPDSLVAGGIVGTNRGTLENCTFEGNIGCREDAGGIAGKNTGLLTDCNFSGSVKAQHRSGGICGYNEGVIEGCTNSGKVNNEEITVESTSVRSFSIRDFDVSDVSEDSFYDISDIGGIAGLSEGVIISCENSGYIGFDRTGYNVGGIVGRQSGKIENCTNNGEVTGKKDVGGIAGQLQPYSSWDFSQSKLTVLRTSIDDIDAKLTKLEQDAHSSSKNIENEVSAIRSYLNAAKTDTNIAVNQIQNNTAELKKTSDLLVAQIKESVKKHDHKKTRELITQLKEIFGKDNTVIDLNEVFDIIAEIRTEEKEHLENEHIDPESENLIEELEEIIADTSYSKPDTESIFKDIKGVSDSASSLKNLLSSDSAIIRQDALDLKNSITSLSDSLTTTAEDLSQIKTDYRKDVSETDNYKKGIISGCINNGNVDAETNAGGITGVTAFEVEFDAEDKLQISDYLLTDANYLIFAVIKDSTSSGEVSAKKQYAGGIAGSSEFGLITDCIASGTINVSTGEYCAGIIGKNGGTVKNSCSRTVMYGVSYVGGIVGNGGKVDSCKAFSYIEKGEENVGIISGGADVDVNNCYFVENGVGGIDGVSYKGKAEPLSYQEMIKLKNIPDIFKKITVTFSANGKTVSVIEVPYGGKIDKLPDVPMDGVKYWKWDKFQNDSILYSQTVGGSYKNPRTTISTAEDIPLFLAEGNFYEGQQLKAEEFSIDTEKEPYDGGKLLSAVKISVNDYIGTFKVRMKADDGGELFLIKDGKEPTVTEYVKDGSYIVFDADNNSSIVYIKKKTINVNPIFLISAGAALVLLFIIVMVIRSVKKKKAVSDEEKE